MNKFIITTTYAILKQKQIAAGDSRAIINYIQIHMLHMFLQDNVLLAAFSCQIGVAVNSTSRPQYVGTMSNLAPTRYCRIHPKYFETNVLHHITQISFEGNGYIHLRCMYLSHHFLI
jgi:hypothetical protein